MESENGKLFGIGLSKTGTSSLAQALQILGFRTKDYPGISRYAAGDLSSVDMDVVHAHEALTDTPIPSFYRELDRRFPGSKFILTVRDRAGWLKSCMKQFNERFAALQNDAHKQLFIDLYGTDVFDERLFANGYEKFVAGVLQYFRDRPADLLILDIAAGDGWEKLCAFLGRPQPDVPFPKANVTQIRWMRIEDLVALAERAGRELMERRVGSDDAPAATAGAMASRKAKRLLDRVAALATGSDPTEAACRAALKIVVSGLRSLGPNVPFLSPTETPPDFTERRDWNHLWLVDPLDGRDSYAAGGTDFTVNVALIEDGRPIYGVVHAPALGLTYFGRVGRGANKKLAGVDAAPLLPVVDRSMRQGELPVRPAHDGRTPGERAGSTSSAALAICRAAESGHLAGSCTPSQPEWKCGAAHAVLAATGAFLIGEADSGAEPRYNSPDLFVPSLSIHAA